MGSTADWRGAANKAHEVLTANSVIEPPVRIDQIAANYGLSVVEASFAPPHENVSGFIDFESKQIVVNRADPLNRKIFTVAHELGHWLLHPDVIAQDHGRTILSRMPLRTADKDPLEQEANCFAANLLVPKEFLDPVKDAPITALANMFGVSQEVIGYRLGRGRRLGVAPDA
jgi:Zn-dependent peptidase ImmA (M78 family)